VRLCIRFVLVLALCLAEGLVGAPFGTQVSRAADTGGWTELPLYGGYVRCLAVNPLTPSTVYAGTFYTGVFRSTDSGATWTVLNPDATDMNVRALAINPLTPTTLYAGTLGMGVLCSTDGGTTWATSLAGPTSSYVYTLVVDPLTPTTLYAGTAGGGVFRSTDGGATWTTANNGLTDLSTPSPLRRCMRRPGVASSVPQTAVPTGWCSPPRLPVRVPSRS
jgi:hypothetical protein